jgi:hypothetical protein
MTTHHLEPGVAGPKTAGPAPDDDALGVLFESSPERVVHTSAAAEVAFLSGLVAIIAVPFSLMVAVCVGLSALGLVTSIVGLARASRPSVSGGLLASIGLVLSLATLTLVGLRYVGIDTAVGDAAVPTLADWLAALNSLLPKP